jgi:sigma-E factor negative regulatory protein RseC
MIQETGVVTEVKEDGVAVVTTARGEACGSCGCGGACQAPGDGPERKMIAINRAGARVGDPVLVSLASGSFLKISSLVYLLPILALVGGSYAGEKYSAQIWASGNPETVSVLTGLFAIVISLMVIRLLAGRMSQNQKYYPTIERVFNPSNCPFTGNTDRSAWSVPEEGNPPSSPFSQVLGTKGG